MSDSVKLLRHAVIRKEGVNAEITLGDLRRFVEITQEFDAELPIEMENYRGNDRDSEPLMRIEVEED